MLREIGVSSRAHGCQFLLARFVKDVHLLPLDSAPANAYTEAFRVGLDPFKIHCIVYIAMENIMSQCVAKVDTPQEIVQNPMLQYCVGPSCWEETTEGQMALQTFNPETCDALKDAYEYGKTATKKQMRNYTKRIVKSLDKKNQGKKKKVRFIHQPITVTFD